MAIESEILEGFKYPCRNCKSVYKPSSERLGFLVELGESPLLSDGEAFSFLRGCKTLFLHYDSIVSANSERFVLLDSKKDPKYFVRIYLNTSSERMEKRREWLESFQKECEGRKVAMYGKDFHIHVNPILEIAQLTQKGCFASLSPYVPVQSEYERYKELYLKSIEEGGEEPLGYEMPLFESLGVYIHPRNFTVDEESGVITVMDLADSIII